MHEPSRRLFREAAIQHYLSTDERGELIRVSRPWTLSVLIVVTVIVLALIVFSFAIEIPEQATTIGVMNGPEVTAFVPAEHIGSIRVGDHVAVALSGDSKNRRMSGGSVVSKSAAASGEIRTAFGDCQQSHTPMYAVKIAIPDLSDSRIASLARQRVTVRYTARRDALVTLIFPRLAPHVRAAH